MTGKQHGRMGCGASVGYLIANSQHIDTTTTLVAMCIIVGSYLPDIDHPKTAFGSNARVIVKILIAIVSLVIFVPLLYIMFIHQAYLLILVIVGVTIRTIWVLKRSKVVNRILTYTTGHRNFVHTIFFLLLLKAPYFLHANEVLVVVCEGLLLGSCVHLIGDGATRSGVRLLNPFTKFRFKYSNFKSENSVPLNIVSWIWVIIFIVVGIIGRTKV